MGSLFEAIEAEEAEVRERVEQLESQVAELTRLLEGERERLSRLVVTRETAGELSARMTGDSVVGEPVREVPSTKDASPFEGAERRVVGVLSVPKWQPGMEPDVLPRVYQDMLGGLPPLPPATHRWTTRGELQDGPEHRGAVGILSLGHCHRPRSGRGRSAFRGRRG